MVPLNEIKPHHVQSFYTGEGGIMVSKLMMLVDTYFDYTMTIGKVPSSQGLILSSAYNQWPGIKIAQAGQPGNWPKWCRPPAV